MRCYIGFDLGGSSMKTGIVTENAEVLAHQKYPVPDSFEALLDLLEQLTRKAMAEYAFWGRRSRLPAASTRRTGRCTAGWPLPSSACGDGTFTTCGPRLSIPVRAEKDGVAAALGEYWAGRRRAARIS